MKKFRIIFIGLFLLGIGFASVSTTLHMDGTIGIAKNNEDFDVKFSRVMLGGADISSTAISSDGKTITYTLNNLLAVGDKSTVNFGLINNSEMYDAQVSVECSTTGDNSSYYQITEEVTSTIEGKTTGTGKVDVKLILAPTSNLNDSFTCHLISKATERTIKAEKVKYMPKYFAYEKGSGLDIPTTASTQDYTTLKYTGTEAQAKVFLGLDNERQKSVCIVINEGIECFKNNNWMRKKST